MTNDHHAVCPSTSLSDERVVALAQAGDAAAFAIIVDRFSGRLLNFIARRLGQNAASISEAEDLVQETFLRAWRSLADFQPTHRFSTWLFTIATRLAVDHARHRRVKLNARAALAHEAERRYRAPDDDRAEEIARVATLWDVAADTLTPDQHAALWLRYAEELSPREIAAVMERSEVAIRVILFRARQALAPHATRFLDMGGRDEDEANAEHASAIARIEPHRSIASRRDRRDRPIIAGVLT